MSEHLSALALDELAAGIPLPTPMPAHIESCSECRGRLARLGDSRRAIRSLPQYAETLARVLQSPPRRKVDRRWFFALAPLAALVALALRFAPSGISDSRVKGIASLRVLHETGDTAANPVRPGERVVLSVGGAGHSYGLVIGLDDRGEASRVWPLEGTTSGAIPPGPDGRLQPAFEVTPGSVTLFAFYSDEPLPASAAETVVKQAGETCRRLGEDMAKADPPTVPGERARAILRLRVEGAP